MKKRLISVILAISMSVSLVIFPSAEYTAKGTGEARDETRTETQAYSSFSYLATGGYDNAYLSTMSYLGETERTLFMEDIPSDVDVLYDINGVLLDGLLADEKTEQKINDWVKAQYKKTGKRGVYYEAVNGYMTVVFGIFYDKDSKERREAITSVWNLKTGEQLKKFSDLFYKDSDFLPAVSESLSHYYVGGFEFEKEPKNFSVTRLTEGYFFDNFFEIDSERDREFQNIFTETYKLMPAWEYFDMTPLFTGEYKGNIENRLDNKTVDFYIESHKTYETESPYLELPYIERSRFLSDAEIKRRNEELFALHEVINESSEYANFRAETEEEEIKGTFAFSEDGKTAIIYTPFGEFTKNGDEIKTPSTDIIMKPEIGFLGYVDFDMDGIPETVTSGEDIEIRNSKDEIIFTIPVGWTVESKKYNKVLLWSTERKENGNVTVRIATEHSAKTYEFIDGKADVYTDEITHGDVSKNVYTENEAVIYALGALDYGELGYASGLAKTNSENLEKQIDDLKKNSQGSYFAMLNIDHGKTLIIGKSAGDDTVYVNKTANKTKDLPDEIIRVRVKDNDPEGGGRDYETAIAFDRRGSAQNEIQIAFSDENTLIYPNDFTAHVKDSELNEKTTALNNLDNADFLGYVDFDMDGTAEKIMTGEDIEIRDSEDKIIFKIPLVFAGESPISLGVEGEYRKTVLWHVEKTENGDVNFNVSIDGYNKRYTVSNGKAELSGESSFSGSYETVSIDMKNENIVYAFGALSKGDKGLTQSAAKANFEKLQAEASDLKNNSSGGFLAMLNIRDGKTQIIGKRAGESILYINGEAFEIYGVPDEIVSVNVAADNSLNSYYGNYAAVFKLDFEEKEYHPVPIYVSLDNRLIMPFSEEAVPDRYYINRDGDEVFEYGAVQINEKTFLTIDGAKEILEKIEADGNTVDNFLFREIEDGFIAEVNVVELSEDGEIRDRTYYTVPVDFDLREDNSKSWRVSGDYTQEDGSISDSYFYSWYIYPIVYPKILPTDFVFDVKSSTPIAKMRAIINKENVDFLGLFDYDMDSTPEVVVREQKKYTKIYSEKGKLLYTFPASETDVVIWYVFKNSDGDIIGSVEGYDYIIKNGEPKPYSGDGPENVLWLENIVYYTLGATDYDDADYASGKAKTEVYKLLSQAKYLEPEGWGNGYFAMLNIEHGKTQIVGISSNGDGIFVNGNLVPSSVDGRLDFYIDPAFDSDRERNEDSLILISSGYGGNIVHTEVPVFITDDDNIALPHGEYGIGNSFGAENGDISVNSIGCNFQPSGEYPKNWASHAYTYEKYFFYRKGDALIEYGAIDFPLEKFKKLKGSEAVLKRISDDEMTIENIFYRGNNEVNINCTREEDGEIWCYYYTYSLNENYEIELDSLVNEYGKYYPSILEEEGLGTAEYPEKLPI